VKQTANLATSNLRPAS